MRDQKHDVNAGTVPSEMPESPSRSFTLQQLLTGVFSKLHPLFSIDCAALVLYDKDHQCITNSYVAARGNACVAKGDNTGIAKPRKIGMRDGNNAEEYYCNVNISHPVKLSPMAKEISGFQFPMLKSAQEWKEQFGENHLLLNHPAEYLFHCYIPLQLEDNSIGTFALHNLKKEFTSEALNYCCNIADLLTGLLSTINADEEELNRIKVSALVENEETINQYIPDASEEPAITYHHPDIAGSSPPMQQVFRLLDKVSLSDTTVLILGETGTGKELIAKAIHNASNRKKKTMVKVNCAAIPPNLIESELFGHEKGSFTGATDRRIGKFEQAHKSTIFLDEVGELSLDLQVKLLRVLQEKEIQRIGGGNIISIDIRIISATNQDLLKEVEAGKFRRDLYYRLNVFPITLPPLRDRKSDIPVLANYFLERFNSKLGRNITGFSKKAVSSMKAYSWPGNVRELEHLIERQVIMAHHPIINDLDISSEEKGTLAHHVTGLPVKTVFENERDHIFSVLERCNGKISGPKGAAKLLGIPPTTLNSKIKKLGLYKKHSFN